MLKLNAIKEFVWQNMYRNMHKSYAKQLLFLFNNVCVYVYLYSIKIIFNTSKGDNIIFTPLNLNFQMLQMQQRFWKKKNCRKFVWTCMWKKTFTYFPINMFVNFGDILLFQKLYNELYKTLFSPEML